VLREEVLRLFGEGCCGVVVFNRFDEPKRL
jgi:hypothetical protein